VGKLCRIVQEVENDLPELFLIRAHGRNIRSNFSNQSNTASVYDRFHGGYSPLNHLVHLDRSHMNLHLAGFDSTEFQQAIDLIEQTLSVIEKILEIVSLQWR